MVSLTASAQINLSPEAAPTNHTPTLALVESAPAPTNPPANIQVTAKSAEQMRNECIQGRRRICGRVQQISADGLVVESGFTDLLRPELGKSWVVPSTVAASRPPNAIEENKPGAACIGTVFVTDIPKKPAVKLYDYVILEAYPAGQHVYTPVPNVTKTIRRFSVGLVTAVHLNLESGEKR